MNAFFRNGLCLWLIIFLITACSIVPSPTPTPEPIVLRFAYLGHSTDYQGLAQEFHEQYPDITIELVPIPVREQFNPFEQLNTQFQEADVVRINATFVGEEQLNATHPLDEFIETSENFPSQDFFPGSLEALQYEQHQLGLPAGLDPMVMFYENIRFKAASVTPLEADYTLENFLASAKQVNKQDASLESGNYSYGFCTTPLDNDPVSIAQLFGGGLYDQMPQPTRPILNSPANVEAITWYVSLWVEHTLAPKVTDNPFQTYIHISSTVCGYWINRLDMYGYAASAPVQGRVLPLPRVDETFGGARSVPALLDGYFVTKNSPNPQAAWHWINFLLERQEASLEQIPPLLWQIESDEYAQRVSPDVLAVAQRLPMDMPFLGLSFLNDPRTGEISNRFQEAVRQVVVEKADVQTALDEAQKQAEKIFNSPGMNNTQP